MTKTALLKIPGVKSSALERLLGFINSDENRPIDDLISDTNKAGKSHHQRYIVLLGVEMEDEGQDPRHQIALKILLEHEVRNGHGGTTAKTPRSVIEEVFRQLDIFPQGS